MLLRSNIFRFSHYAYEFASKKKLNIFINLIVFVSIFALSASGLSMFYENKIDKIDKEIILFKNQKLILENQISTAPRSINRIDLLLENDLKKKLNQELLKEVNLQGDEDVNFIYGRQLYYYPYYQVISLIDLSVLEISSYLIDMKTIFKNNRIVCRRN